jgi:hypothetical protein
MKPAPTSNLLSNRARPVLRPSTQPPHQRTMRSTVLQSLLLAPDGGVPPHRHGVGASRNRTF